MPLFTQPEFFQAIYPKELNSPKNVIAGLLTLYHFGGGWEDTHPIRVCCFLPLSDCRSKSSDTGSSDKFSPSKCYLLSSIPWMQKLFIFITYTNYCCQHRIQAPERGSSYNTIALIPTSSWLLPSLPRVY